MIGARDLSLAFGATPVLAGVTLDIPAGTSLAVIGPSGTGKSVLLKCLLGLMTPDAGAVLLDGAPVIGARGWAALRARAGVLFQGAALFDSLRVWENVAFRFLHGPRRLPRPQARALALERLARVGLPRDVADRAPAALSGGMQKRAGLARAIAADPDLLFFDEPTTGLDPIAAGQIDALIREIVTERGATALTITHDLASVHRIADEVALLAGGALRWRGPAAELPHCEEPHVRQFVEGRAEGPIRAGV